MIIYTLQELVNDYWEPVSGYTTFETAMINAKRRKSESISVRVVREEVFYEFDSSYNQEYHI